MNRLFLLSVFLVLFGIDAYSSSFNLIRKHNIVFDNSEEQVVHTAVDIFKPTWKRSLMKILLTANQNLSSVQ